jgi:hypothetical protein
MGLGLLSQSRGADFKTPGLLGCQLEAVILRKWPVLMRLADLFGELCLVTTRKERPARLTGRFYFLGLIYLPSDG